MRPAQPWIIWWATGVHLILGIALVLHPASERLSVLLGLRGFIDLIGAQAFGGLLILISAWAVAGILREAVIRRHWIIIHLFPQYFLVIAAFLSNALILVAGEYEGQPFNFWTGLIGLWPTILASGLHTFAVIERYFIRWNQ